jgi:hypothetical protein
VGKFYSYRTGNFRSNFEARVAQDLERQGAEAYYEAVTLDYVITHTYTPDWVLGNGIIIETKGHFSSADRRKMLAVKAAHPHLDIRMLFMQPFNPLRKGSKKTYANWCEDNHIPWAAGPYVPTDWLK